MIEPKKQELLPMVLQKKVWLTGCLQRLRQEEGTLDEIVPESEELLSMVLQKLVCLARSLQRLRQLQRQQVVGWRLLHP